MKLRIALILLVITLLVIVPVYAQDATPEAAGAATLEAGAAATVEAGQPETHPVAGVPETNETDNIAPGATVLVLLIGLGAIGLVGFTALMRENYKPSGK